MRFPLFLMVSLHALYSLFQNPEFPARYAFCSSLTLTPPAPS